MQRVTISKREEKALIDMVVQTIEFIESERAAEKLIDRLRVIDPGAAHNVNRPYVPHDYRRDQVKLLFGFGIFILMFLAVFIWAFTRLKHDRDAINAYNQKYNQLTHDRNR